VLWTENSNGEELPKLFHSARGGGMSKSYWYCGWCGIFAMRDLNLPNNQTIKMQHHAKLFEDHPKNYSSTSSESGPICVLFTFIFVLLHRRITAAASAKSRSNNCSETMRLLIVQLFAIVSGLTSSKAILLYIELLWAELIVVSR
jgi:hypothetical protein